MVRESPQVVIQELSNLLDESPEEIEKVIEFFLERSALFVDRSVPFFVHNMYEEGSTYCRKGYFWFYTARRFLKMKYLKRWSKLKSKWKKQHPKLPLINCIQKKTSSQPNQETTPTPSTEQSPSKEE